MEVKKYTEQNRAAWNEVSRFHVKAREQKKGTKQGLDPVITSFMEEHTIIKGKNVAQLCCNNGIETMALKKMGALTCIGFDISDEAIAEAKKLNGEEKLDCHFVRTDVYDIPKVYDNSFDLVFISAGALTWLPDLMEFFPVVYRILKESGQLLIYEIHPFIWMLEEAPKNNPLKLSSSYFKKGPVVSYGGLDYIGHEEYQGKINYTFDHTISQIINSILVQSFNIKKYNEYSHDISACFEHLEKEKIKIPMSFILYAKK